MSETPSGEGWWCMDRCQSLPGGRLVSTEGMRARARATKAHTWAKAESRSVVKRLGDMCESESHKGPHMGQSGEQVCEYVPMILPLVRQCEGRRRPDTVGNTPPGVYLLLGCRSKRKASVREREPRAHMCGQSGAEAGLWSSLGGVTTHRLTNQSCSHSQLDGRYPRCIARLCRTACPKASWTIVTQTSRGRTAV